MDVISCLIAVIEATKAAVAELRLALNEVRVPEPHPDVIRHVCGNGGRVLRVQGRQNTPRRARPNIIA
jgi:hypothetical protein